MGKRNRKKNKIKNGNNNIHSNHGDIYDTPKEVVHFAEQIEKPQTTKKTILTLAIALILALGLTFVILFSTGLIDKNDLNIMSLVSGDDSWTNISGILEIEETDKEPQEKLTNPRANKDDSIKEANYMTIKFPTLIGPQYEELKIEGDKINCDTIWWIERIVPYTKAPLNATYREMFSFDQELDFYTGNYVSKLKNLSFDYATIENRIANVYLKGEINISESESEDDCEKNRLKTQITEAALQFETIDGVVIYLNNDIFQS